MKIIKTNDGFRLIKGKYAEVFDFDFGQNLEDLQKDIEAALPLLLENLSPIDKLTVDGDVLVYRGNDHIDIVLDGEGSLGWLTVGDYRHL